MRCTACAPCCPVRLTLPPLAGLFPTALTLWMSTWCKWLAGPPAWALKRAWQESPGPAQGGRAEPGGTDYARVVDHHGHLDMPAQPRHASFIFLRHPNYGRLATVRRGRCRWRVCRRRVNGGRPQHLLNIGVDLATTVGCTSHVAMASWWCEPWSAASVAAAALLSGSTGWCQGLQC